MAAWERFLTGDPAAAIPARNFVVASWLRSQELGINPTGRSAPIVARGDAIEQLRRHHADLVSAAAEVFAEVAEMFSGSRSIMLLTNNDGVVLDAVGDRHTLEQGEAIHLTRGGDWREDAVGTNGIGTALATGRPAQVHAAEHFCEGIKAWTCAPPPRIGPGPGRQRGGGGGRYLGAAVHLRAQQPVARGVGRPAGRDGPGGARGERAHAPA